MSFPQRITPRVKQWADSLDDKQRCSPILIRAGARAKRPVQASARPSLRRRIARLGSQVLTASILAGLLVLSVVVGTTVIAFGLLATFMSAAWLTINR